MLRAFQILFHGVFHDAAAVSDYSDHYLVEDLIIYVLVLFLNKDFLSLNHLFSFNYFRSFVSQSF